MALRMAEGGQSFTLLHTPTGDEFPEVAYHVAKVANLAGVPLVCPSGRGLRDWIHEFEALPNPRQRWCTRLVKIVPCRDWLIAHPGSTLCVGLRADEPEREGMYGEQAIYRYPLREWGWGRREVLSFLGARQINVPRRTDCFYCPYQRLGEWRDLWRDRPGFYAIAERLEEQIGHTFRSPSRDTWPAGLKELRAEFERGRPIRGDRPDSACRVCRDD